MARQIPIEKAGKLATWLRSIPRKDARNAAVEVLTPGAELIVNQYQAIVPRRTGKTAAAAKVRRTRDFRESGGGVAFRVTAGVRGKARGHVARFIEFGTEFLPPGGYLSAAYATAQQGAQDKIADGMRTVLTHAAARGVH